MLSEKGCSTIFEGFAAIPQKALMLSINIYVRIGEELQH
jgi:hypothetical protein